jgi:hypothetical protein
MRNISTHQDELRRVAGRSGKSTDMSDGMTRGVNQIEGPIAVEVQRLVLAQRETTIVVGFEVDFDKLPPLPGLLVDLAVCLCWPGRDEAFLEAWADEEIGRC